MRHVRLPTLEYQRRGDLIVNYTSGIYYVKSPQLTMTTYSLTPGNRKKIFMTSARTKLKSSFFYEGVVADWYSLPDDVVTAPSIGCFKARLDTHWKNLQSIF